MSEQVLNLERVYDKIAECIIEFCNQRNQSKQPLFHMEDLQRFVADKLLIAPDSPSRILRALRQEGRIDYMVVNRRQSLYSLLPVESSGS